MLSAKFTNFLQKSVFRYLFASLLLALTLPWNSLGYIQKFLICFSLCIVASVLIILSSAYLQSKQRANDLLTIEFLENSIEIQKTESGKTEIKEIKDWGFIKKSSETNELITIEFDKSFTWFGKNYVFISKSNLPAQEVIVLRNYLLQHDKLIVK